MRLVERLRTTSTKATLCYALLFALSVSLIMGITYLAVEHELRRAVLSGVAEDAGTMQAEYKEGGFPEILEEIQERLDQNTSDERIYYLGDGRSRRVEGNIASLPVHEGSFEGIVDYATGKGSAAQRASPAIVTVVRYPDAVFAVGRNLLDLNRALDVVLACFAIGTLATLLLSFIVGHVLGKLVLRRLALMSETAGAIVSGQLSRRMPVSQSGDEFDRLSRDINHMLDRIQELMESLQQVSNDIAHDLRTPLQRLKQTLEGALTDRGVGVKEVRGYVRKASKEADMIIETFNALLRIAEVESGARKRHFQTINLSEHLANLCDIYRPVAESAGIGMSTSVQPGISILGDGELLTQLFTNVIENALRHIPRGEMVDVSLAQTEDSCIVVIADTGPGIPSGERDRVFRPLYRLERSRTTPGTGLGLSLAKAIVSLHVGTIVLHSNDPGLRVEMSLPATESPSS